MVAVPRPPSADRDLSTRTPSRLSALRRALRPTPAPLAVRRAIWTVVAAGAVAGVAVASGGLAQLGVAYFGTACAAVFVTSGAYRTRVVALSSQGLGATAGLALGVIGGSSTPGRIVVAAVVGVACGMIGAIGRMATAFALMAVIGVGFSQFGGVHLAWWQAAGWYLVGTAAVFVVAVPAWLFRRRRPEWEAVADVLDASADLLHAVGTPDAQSARLQLAASSAAERAAVFDHRLRQRIDRRLAVAVTVAERTALASAALHADGRTVPASAVDAVATTAREVRVAHLVPHAADIPSESPGLVSLAEALERTDDSDAPVEIADRLRPLRTRIRASWRVVTTRGAVLAGLRLGLCMGVATAVTAALHGQSHSYWLPLTVAVIVRPEYASVFVRTVNRVVGTLAGATVAAVVVLVVASGWPVAVVAAVSIGFAVLVAPRLYALSVVGITSSALMSAYIAGPDPIYPGLRLLDTVIGAAIALLLGYVLWPGRHTLPSDARLDGASEATIRYLVQAARPPAVRRDWPEVRDEAYRVTHTTRTAAEAGLADPPPVCTLAAASLPGAMALEDAVDDVSRLSIQIDAGMAPPAPEQLDSMVGRLRALAQPSRSP